MKNGCPRIFNPLCASNGKTYANLCELCVKSYRITEVERTNMGPLTIQYEGTWLHCLFILQYSLYNNRPFGGADWN